MRARTRLFLGAIVSFFVASCLGLRTGHAPVDMTCRVELVREPELLVRVTIDARGDADGETTFAIADSWAARRDAHAMLRDLTVASNGRDLDVQQTKPGRWTVHHAPNVALTCSYAIPANAMQRAHDSSGFYKPIVGAGLVHFIGHNGLALPDHDDEPKQHVRFEWIGFVESGWSCASSFGNGREFEADLTSSDLHAAVFLAAPDLEVHHRSIRGRDLCVAFAGAWSGPRAPFVDAAAKIVDVERAFFDDDSCPSFLVSVVPVGTPSPGSSSLNGTSLTHSFALFLLDRTDIDPGTASGSRLLHLLAHEMFHAWNGCVVQLADPEQRMYWLSEGFTDFYARRLLHRAGLMDDDAFVASWNDRFREFFANPARAASAERIEREFWTDEDVKNVPYQRGDVVALAIDAELRRRSGGARSLDGWMRDLVEAGRRGARVDNDSLTADLARRTDPEFAAAIRSVVVDGSMPDLRPDVLAPCFDLAIEPLPTWDPGLDMAATRVDYVVRGVREGSNAWIAGLRDGMELAAWGIFYGDCDRRMQCTIREGATTRDLSWMPRGPAVDTPRIRPITKAPPGGCPEL